MFDTKKFGAYVAWRRKNADLTQSELAKKLCLTRQAISKYEVGDSFPDILILVQMAETFNVSLDDLINSGNPTKGEVKIIKNDPDIDISHIISLLQYLYDDGILQVVSTAKYSSLDDELLEKIIPFLDASSKEAILKKIIEDECDWHLIRALLPYMESMAPQLEAAVIEGVLPNEVLEIMNNYFMREMME